MPDYRKPPLHNRSRSDVAPPASDSEGFSIETTTMRLKSLKLRRTEAELREVDNLTKPSDSREAAEESRRGPSGKVKHDERGMAVWDWAVATGEFATLSATRALKKLEVADLSIEDHKPKKEFSLAVSGRDKAGGGDPYNQRGSGQRPGGASQRQGVTGADDKKAVLDQLLGKKK